MIVAGLGLRQTAQIGALREVLRLTGGPAPDALACLAIKAANPAVVALAEETGLPLITLEETEIAGQETPTCSPRIKARFATGSIAEACALAAARGGDYGAHVRLICARVISLDGMATAALAERTTK